MLFESLDHRRTLAGDVEIVADGMGDVASYRRTVDLAGEVTYSPVSELARIDASKIANDLDSGHRVVVETANGTESVSGDITIRSSIVKRTAGPASLAFRADNDIVVAGSIRSMGSSDAALDLTFNSDHDQAGGGRVVVEAAAIVSTLGGSITIGGGTDPLSIPASGHAVASDGVVIQGNLFTASGRVSVLGIGATASTVASSDAPASGVLLGGAIRTTSGSVQIVGSAGLGNSDSDGVRVSGQIVSQTGRVTVDGNVASVNAVESSNSNGVELRGGVIASAGNIEISGDVTSENAAGTKNHGVLIQSASRVVSIAGVNAAPTIEIRGSANTPQATDSDGVHVTGVGSEIFSDVANITITGSSAGDGLDMANDGVELAASTLVTSTGFAGRSGSVSVTGSSGGGRDGGRGVRINDLVSIASLGDNDDASIEILGVSSPLVTDDRIGVEIGGDLDAKSVTIKSSDSVVVNDTAAITSDEALVTLGTAGRIANRISINLDSIANASGSFLVDGNGSFDRLQLISGFLSRVTTEITGDSQVALVADGRRIDLRNIGSIDVIADVAHSSVTLGDRPSEQVTVESKGTDHAILVRTDAGLTVQTRPQRTFALNTGRGVDSVDVTSFRTSLTTSVSFEDGDEVDNDQWTLSGDFTSTTGTTSLTVDALRIRVAANIDSVSASVALGQSPSTELIELVLTEIIAGQVQFAAPVQIQTSAAVQSISGPTEFADTVSGPGDLLVDSAAEIRFSADVGRSTPLASLDARAIDNIFTQGSLIASGDLRFRSSVQTVGQQPTQFSSRVGVVAFEQTLDAADGNQVSIDSHLPAEVSGDIGSRSAPTGFDLLSGGPLRIDIPIRVDGDIDIAVRDTATDNDTFVLSDGASLHAAGNVRVNAGDEIVIQPEANIAADTVTLEVDVSATSASDLGGTVIVQGTAESRLGPVIISGGDDNDSIVIDLATSRTARQFHVIGGDQTATNAGDRIAFSGADSVSPRPITMTLTEQSQGSVGFMGGPIVSFENVEIVEPGQASNLSIDFDSIDDLDFTIRNHGQAGFVELVGSNGLQTKVVFANPTERLTLSLTDGNDRATIQTLDDAYAIPIVIDGSAGSDELLVQNAIFTNIGGRALDIVQVESVSIQDSNFTGNRAESGAAIRMQGGSIDIERTTFAQNVANRRGGAIEVVDGRISVLDSLFLANASGESGGAISAASSTGFTEAVEVNSTTFRRNQSGGSGGGVFIENLDATFDDVTFTENVASGNAWQVSRGGGLAIEGSRSYVPDVRLSNVTLDQNSAETGGGVSAVDAQLRLVRSTVAENHASSIVYGGGGIAVATTRSAIASALSISESKIDGNIATGEGGGVMLVGVGASIDNSSFESNSAENGVGGGISVFNNGVTGDLRITDTMVHGNVAGQSGGGVAIVGASVDWKRVTVTGNQAGTFAGGLDFINHDSLTSRSIVDSSITDNAALAGENDISQTGIPLQFTNAAESELDFDVNRDGVITSIDALMVVNRIAKIPPSGELVSAQPANRVATDVNGDGETTALDALMIINQLTRQTLVQMNSRAVWVTTEFASRGEFDGESRLF
ncbi:MAG: dockerin type I domain-containing protein [Rubripirellula sp.]